jgi:hypothetical protein
MKELTAAFQSEVFHPIATLVVPGFFSVSTLATAVWQRHPSVQKFAEGHSGLSTTIALLVVLTVGLITEDLGARLEHVFDERLSRKVGYELHEKEWFDYLRIAFDREPIGQRYLRTLVLRLKFELGMAIAAVPFAIGAMYLQTSCLARTLVVGIALVALVYFLAEAKSSNKTLSDLRRELLKKNWDPALKNTAPPPLP